VHGLRGGKRKKCCADMSHNSPTAGADKGHSGTEINSTDGFTPLPENMHHTPCLVKLSYRLSMYYNDYKATKNSKQIKQNSHANGDYKKHGSWTKLVSK
jgi:hypothetical protein